MKAVLSLLILGVLAAMAFVGVEVMNLTVLFGIVVPYFALSTFAAGTVYRILRWARAPVPFRIPTTCGQQKSFGWIKASSLDNPSTTLGVVGRMALEVLFFRSLFRNTKAELREGPRVVYGPNKWLWAAALVFHWSLLVVVIRHGRFFLEPVPFPVRFAERADSYFQVGLPIVYATDIALFLSLSFLAARRLWIVPVRYISLVADYFPLFLILGIALSGFWMRYADRTDIVAAKALGAGLFGFRPLVPAGMGASFYVHLFLVCVLLVYFPFSKLMHAGGVFFSPTRNLANNSRARRHVNPWDYPVKLHGYEEYEDEFRDKMIEAGIPVEKEV